MKWIVVCVLLVMAIPSWAGNKAPKKVQKQKIVEKEPEIQCINGIEGFNEMVPLNPYDNVNRCFRYDLGKNLQLLDRTHALYGLYTDENPFALIDFGEQSAPNLFSGVVRGKGAFPYEAVNGSHKVINLFVVMTSTEIDKALEIKKKKDQAAETKRLGPEGVKKREEEQKRFEEKQRDIDEERRIKSKERWDMMSAERNKSETAERVQKEADKQRKIEIMNEKLKKCREDGVPCEVDDAL